MRLKIAIAKTATGWTLTYIASDAAFVLAPRELRTDEGTLPLFPEAEAARWNGAAHAAFGTADSAGHTTRSDALKEISLGGADATIRRHLGNYLTEVLLGVHLDAVAQLPANEPLELYLTMAPDEKLQAIPWELLYAGDDPLALARPLAIARIVKNENAGAKWTPFTLPLKVLFVVGQGLDDESIRPGAEYMALVRKIAGDEEDTRVANLNTRILLQATPDEIRSAVADFVPSVVHFICHGDTDGSGATLLLAKKEGDVKTFKNAVRAKVLLEILTYNDQLPSAVVLNACHTAEAAQNPEQKEAYRGYAATLVAGGVPVVVGMAGEVADGACRIFTSEFYQALLNGDSVVMASSRGRRAALLGYLEYRETAEWARPTLFVAEGQACSFAVGDANRKLGPAAAKYVREKQPRSLCGRLDAVIAFESLLGRVLSGQGNRFTLGLGVTESTKQEKDHCPAQYGKTRLLEEMAVRLTLSGIAPVMLWNENDVRKAENALELVLQLADEMNETRTRFGVGQVAKTATLKFVVFNFGGPSDGTPEGDLTAESNALNAVRTRGNEIAAGAVRNLLVNEIESLVSDLASAGISKAAILIDDLDKYEGCVEDLKGMVKEAGLGKGGAIVALLFTFSRYDKANGDLLAEFLRTRGQYVALGPISDDSEHMLAIRQYMLTNRKLPLAFARTREARDYVKDIENAFRAIAEGVPGWWQLIELYATLSVYKNVKMLVSADDDGILQLHGQ
jgi:hypothetical protein